jgi:ELWxxDGT repeat protein
MLVNAMAGAAGSAPDLRGNLIVGGVVDPTRLLYLLDNGTNGTELWVTDGTTAGTALFKDINPGAGGATVSSWTAVNGRAVFIADNGTTGAELWVSDGTAAGTVLLADLRPGSEGSNPTIVGNVALNGAVDPSRLLVLLDNGTTGQELWVTDGTLAGTTLWNDANPGSAGSFATDTTMEVMGASIDLTPATGPVTLALGETGIAQTVIGSTFADAIVGNEKANTITSGDGDDVVLTVGGDDTVDAGAGNDLLNGGAGSNTAIFHGIRGASEIRFDSKTFDLTVVGPDGVDTLTNMQVLQFTDMTVNAFDTTGVRHLVNVSFPATSTDQFMLGNAYTGPVPGLTDEFIFPTPQNINIASALPNSFIRTGTGDDAITVFTGNNVVDAYQGSNFLTSGTGNDTFFVDARGGGSTWDTIVNFTAGDAVTLWGYKNGTSTDGTTDKWYASDGTPGFTGLTVHAKLDGTTINASITFAGATLDDLAKFSVTTGNVAGNDYLQITRAT